MSELLSQTFIAFPDCYAKLLIELHISSFIHKLLLHKIHQDSPQNSRTPTYIPTNKHINASVILLNFQARVLI